MQEKMTWPDEIQDVLAGDLVTAFSYLTPAGGAVAIPVAPAGVLDREAGSVSVTTSLAFIEKLRRILRNRHVAMAYHTRDHGFATRSTFVLAQGDAAVELVPSPARLNAIAPDIVRFLGAPPTGRLWDWLLREYFEQRVIIDIAVTRVTSWPTLDAAGNASTIGAPWPSHAPESQKPPARGTGPRVDHKKLYHRLGKLPHQVLAYQGSDGRPTVLPVHVAGVNQHGLVLQATDGLLPSGARRAGLTAHSFGPQAIGLSNRVCTGWLEVCDGVTTYAPHTAGGFTAPANKTVQTLFNGLLSKQRLRHVRRSGVLDELAALQTGYPATRGKYGRSG